MIYARLYFYACAMGLILTSCTYSITMVHTQGQADDVVDETQTSDPDIKPNLSIPTI